MLDPSSCRLAYAVLWKTHFSTWGMGSPFLTPKIHSLLEHRCVWLVRSADPTDSSGTLGAPPAGGGRASRCRRGRGPKQRPYCVFGAGSVTVQTCGQVLPGAAETVAGMRGQTDTAVTRARVSGLYTLYGAARGSAAEGLLRSPSSFCRGDPVGPHLRSYTFYPRSSLSVLVIAGRSSVIGVRCRNASAFSCRP